MQSVTRYLLGVFLLAAIIQCIFLKLVIELTWKDVLDSHNKINSIFQHEPRVAIYGSPMIVRGSHKPQVVILGVSNTIRALRPEQLQPLLGDVRVHNIGIAGQRFRSFDQLVELLYRQTPKENRRNYIFVIAPSFPLIGDKKENVERVKSVVDDEMLRYGIFKDAPHGAVPRFPDYILPFALQVVWPFMVPEAIYVQAMQTFLPEIIWSYFLKAIPLSDEETNTITLTPEENNERIAVYNSLVLDKEGKHSFDYLARTVERITAEGGQLVVVDLPSAVWLQEATPLYALYQQVKLPYLQRLQTHPNIRFIDLQEGFLDDDFYDGIHVRARISPKIAALVAPSIKQALDAL